MGNIPPTLSIALPAEAGARRPRETNDATSRERIRAPIFQRTRLGKNPGVTISDRDPGPRVLRTAAPIAEFARSSGRTP